MSKPKVATRNVAVALGILCAILVVSLIGAVMSYTSSMNTKDQIISEKESLIQILVPEKNQFQTWMYGNISECNTYKDSHHHTDTEYNGVQSNYNTVVAPNLIKVAWNEEDVHSGNWHLHVSGAVVNVGTNTAYNSKIHVVCYQGIKVGLDTYIMLYTINGETSKAVDENLYYAYGSGLTAWSVTLEWTNTP